MIVDSSYQEIESISGTEKDSGAFVFSIDLGTSRTMYLDTWKPAFREESEFVPMAKVKYSFEEEKVDQEAEMRIQPKGGVVVFDNDMARTLAAASIHYMDRDLEGICLIEGVEMESEVTLFQINVKKRM